VCDTRKTTPGLRIREKYAVTVGGGANHRFGLDDGILIKDNHLLAVPGETPELRVAEAIAAVRDEAPHTLRIEVECETLDEVRAALDAGADAVLLDNMPLARLRKAVEMCRAHGDVLIEVSGGVTLETITDIAACDVDIISVGALTHSAPAIDIALDVRPAH
jgi:nicotinate-nucleotide pyrophosphorylase (carboxylating)